MDSAGSGRLRNPFNDAQQAQLRAQIIIYGSILREHLPEETLMSLCFADISQGSTVEDFHEDNLRRSTWENIWEDSSKRIREKPPPASRLLQSRKKPGSANVCPSSKPTSASKPLKAPKSIAANRAATAKSKRVAPSNGLVTHLEEVKMEANEAASVADLTESHGKQAWDKINEKKCPEPSNTAVAKVACDAAVQADMVVDPPASEDETQRALPPSSNKTKTLDAAVEATALAETAVCEPEALEPMVPSGLESLAEAGTEAYWKLSEDLKAGAGSASMHDEANMLKGSEDDTKSNEGREGPLPDAEDEVQHMYKRRKTTPKSKEKPQDDESIRLEFVEGSHVEVVSDEEGLHGVWFSGKVLGVRNKKVHVIYDELLDEDGNERLEEWVLVYSTQGAAPRVRLAHPVTSSDLPLKHKGFSVGDHIDVWMNDGWWEGVVEGINSDNTNEITVFFPGEGDIGVANLSNLRPALTWKDGKWVPWTREACKTDHSKTKEPKKPKAERAVHKEEESLVLDGKRKREKPKRLEDELDDRASAKRTQQQEGKHIDTRSRRLLQEGRADASAKKTQPSSSKAADIPAKKTQQAASKTPAKKIVKRKPEPEEKPRNIKPKKAPPSKKSASSSSSGKQGKDKKAKNTKAKKTSLRNKGLK